MPEHPRKFALFLVKEESVAFLIQKRDSAQHEVRESVSP